MSNELKPPTNQEEALQLIEPLNPALPKGTFTREETDIAFFRLQEFINLLFPKK